MKKEHSCGLTHGYGPGEETEENHHEFSGESGWAAWKKKAGTHLSTHKERYKSAGKAAYHLTAMPFNPLGHASSYRKNARKALGFKK